MEPTLAQEQYPRRRTPQLRSPTVADSKIPLLSCSTLDRPSAHGQAAEERLTALLEYHDLSLWRRSIADDLIETGYRPTIPALGQCLVDSCRRWHNESVNIYSHLVASVLFGAGLVLVTSFCIIQKPVGSSHQRPVVDHTISLYHGVTSGDVVLFTIYLLGVTICFAFSALFHAMLCHSPRSVQIGFQLDFLGVIVLMGSAAPAVAWYTFRERRDVQRRYWIATACLSSLAALATLVHVFRLPSLRLLRVAVFGSLALSSLVCVAHGIYSHGIAIQDRRFPLWSIGLTLFLNTSGAGIYVLRFPERWWPRRFDFVGASHQIMHVAIVAASLTWLAGMAIACARNGLQ